VLFLRNWLGEMGMNPDLRSQSNLLRKIEKKTRRIRRHNRK
jgi:hypothetical protein